MRKSEDAFVSTTNRGGNMNSSPYQRADEQPHTAPSDSKALPPASAPSFPPSHRPPAPETHIDSSIVSMAITPTSIQSQANSLGSHRATDAVYPYQKTQLVYKTTPLFRFNGQVSPKYTYPILETTNYASNPLSPTPPKAELLTGRQGQMPTNVNRIYNKSLHSDSVQRQIQVASSNVISEADQYIENYKSAEAKPLFITYYNQECSGVMVSMSEGSSIMAATEECLRVGCQAINTRIKTEGIYTFVYLATTWGRSNKKGVYCMSVKEIPMGKIEPMQISSKFSELMKQSWESGRLPY
uniref:Hillarin n=1 Tax=Angiostrongylus cantonensis TaxID=6313 RepID=A0A158P9J9_ANGCA